MIAKDVPLLLEGDRDTIDPITLSTIPTRIAHTCKFTNFGPETDRALIHATSSLLNVNLAPILDTIFSKLLSTKLTADILALQRPKDMSNPNAPIPPAIHPPDLHLQHPQVLFRKKVLGERVHVAPGQLHGLVGLGVDLGVYRPAESSHTGRSALKEKYGGAPVDPLSIPYLHVGLQGSLMVEAMVDVIMDAAEGEGWRYGQNVAAVKAWNKLMWLPNDLYARHYISCERTGRICV